MKNAFHPPSWSIVSTHSALAITLTSTLLTHCAKPDATKRSRGVTSQRTNEGATSATTVPFPDAPDALQYNLKRLNDYRRETGLSEFVLDKALSNFATDGNKDAAATQVAHGHFKQAVHDAPAFCNSVGENQSFHRPTEDLHASIDGMLASMMAEGPGGGHHDNILNPDFHRVGLAVDVIDGELYITNDFSSVCEP